MADKTSPDKAGTVPAPGGVAGSGEASTNNFGERVRLSREKAGLTQKKLAKAVGVSGTTIQNYESGQLPSGPQSVNLAKALGCSLDWLFFGRYPGREAEEDVLSGTREPSAPFSAAEDLEALRRDNRSLREDNQLLRRENAELRQELTELRKENRELVKIEAKYLRIRPDRETPPEEESSRRSA